MYGWPLTLLDMGATFEQPNRPAMGSARSWDASGVVLVLAWLLAGLALVKVWRAGENAPGIDYYEFWVAVEAVREQAVPDIYAEPAKAVLAERYLKEEVVPPVGRAVSARQQAVARATPGIGIMGTPALHATLSLLQRGDYDEDIGRFQLAGLAAFAAGVMLLGRAYKMPLAWPLLALAWLAMFYGPLASDVHAANVNRWQLGMVGLEAWLLARAEKRGRCALAGAVLAFAVLFKPNVGLGALLLVWHWAWARRWKRLGWFAGGAAAAGVATLIGSAIFFGSFGCWENWLAMTGQVEYSTFPVKEGNFSLAEVVFAWTGVRLGMGPAVVFVGGALAAVAMAAVRGRGRTEGSVMAGEAWASGPEPGLLAVGCALWMLVAQLAWFHYFLLVVPLILWALRPALGGTAGCGGWWLAQRVAAVLVLVVLNPVVIGAMLPLSPWAWPLLLNVVVAVLVAVVLG